MATAWCGLTWKVRQGAAQKTGVHVPDLAEGRFPITGCDRRQELATRRELAGRGHSLDRASRLVTVELPKVHRAALIARTQVAAQGDERLVILPNKGLDRTLVSLEKLLRCAGLGIYPTIAPTR